MSDQYETAKRYKTLAFECAAAARIAATPTAKEEYKKIAAHYESLAEAEAKLAEAYENAEDWGKSLHLRCPNRKTEFDSGIQVSRQALARIEQIAVRLQCPLCGVTHLLIEKGELDEGY